MPNLRGSEWLIIILLLVLLFGARRLPDAARSIGRSLRIFKAETKGLVDDNAAPAGASQPAPTVTQLRTRPDHSRCRAGGAAGRPAAARATSARPGGRGAPGGWLPVATTA